MAKKTTVTTGEWAKHLRKYGKREFWKKDRKAGKTDARAPLKLAGPWLGRANRRDE